MNDDIIDLDKLEFKDEASRQQLVERFKKLANFGKITHGGRVIAIFIRGDLRHLRDR